MSEIKMSQNCSKIDLRTIAQISGTLESVVRHAYGPRGSKILLSTETGQVVISSDGATVLRVLQFSHPIAKLVVDSMTRTVNYTGDGSKTFILYVAYFLRELALYDQPRGSFEAYAYLKALQTIKVDINKKLSIYIKKESSNKSNEFTMELYKNVIQTCLSNSFKIGEREHLASVALETFRNNGNNRHQVTEVLDVLIDNFEELCIKIPNLPYKESRTMPLIIIQRKFANFSQSSSTNPRFIVCRFAISGHEKNLETRETIRLQSKDTLAEFMNHHRLILRRFVDKCKNEGINIVLCSEVVSEESLQYFKSAEISVVPYVSDEDCNLLCKIFQMKPCSSILEEIDSGMIRAAKTCRPVIINGRQCAHLDLSNHYNQLMLPEMLLICAPTEGLCNQLCLKLRKTYQTLLVGIRQDPETSAGNEDIQPSPLHKTAYVGGGGTFELLTSEFILKLDENKGDVLSRTCQLLSKSLLNIPFTLFQNNSISSQTNLRRYILSLGQIHKSRSPGCCLGIDRFGQPADLCASGVIELTEVKVHVLLSAIELIQQILRVDCILGVKKMQ